MRRRWLRDNPHLPGNPNGRGVALLQQLEQAGIAARGDAQPHWRMLRGKGLTANQAAHVRHQLGAWAHLTDTEQAELSRTLVGSAGLPEPAMESLIKSAVLDRWTTRVRETNATISGLEVRIHDLRVLLAGGDVDEVAGPDAATDPQEEILALSEQCQLLQSTLVHDLLAACIDLVPDVLHTMASDGIFLPEEVREFPALSGASAPAVS